METQGNGLKNLNPQKGYQPDPLYSFMSKVPSTSSHSLACIFSIPPCSSPHAFTGLKIRNPAHMRDQPPVGEWI